MTTTIRTLRRCLFACVLVGCAGDDTQNSNLPADAGTGTGVIDPARNAALLTRAKLLVRPGSVTQTDSTLGVPTFLWTRDQVTPASAARWPIAGVVQPEVAASRAVLADYAPLYGLADTDVANAIVTSVHDRGTGAVLVKLRAQRNGIDIFNEELGVILNHKLEGIAISGYLTGDSTPPAQSGGLAFQLSAPAAAAAAVNALANTTVGAGMVVGAGAHDGYDYFTLSAAAGVALDEPIRLKKVYYHLPGGLEAGYYVEVLAQTGAAPVDMLSADGNQLAASEAYGFVISAVTGRALFRNNLSADYGKAPTSESNLLASGFTYRVWADPLTGIPSDSPAGNAVHPNVSGVPDGSQAAFVPTSDVTLSNFPFSQNDPWLAPGATETIGNNVDAYLNLLTPDGYGSPTSSTPTDPATADFRAQITGANQFLHAQTPDRNGGLAEGRQGAIQQLFYDINFMHDWYYDAGFNEAAGNAQTNNYGRGGLGDDSIKAQAQDFQSFSNANMLTPADGSRPRMRMYVFPSLANTLDLQAPLAIAGKVQLGISMSGPQAYEITNQIVKATFSNSPSSCTVTNAGSLPSTIALFDFDNTDGTGCSFSTRITRLTATGASAIIMVYTQASPTVVANITGYVTANTKPVATISWNSGQLIKAQLSVPTPVMARLYRAADRDGTLDNQIIAHEWFHYVSNRLIANGSGFSTNLSGGMGEGWSDFNSLMLTARPDDTSTASNATFNGAYAMATFATSGVPFNGAMNQGYYFGIRRYPYSTDMSKNPLTFKHIANGVALPVGPPLAFGANGAANNEVHNTGEVWTSMLWECYAALLRDTLGTTPRLTFQQAQDRMKQYLIAGLKVTPASPTFLEGRDALLAVALANDPIDYLAFKFAFAKRGAGVHAVSPDRYSSDNTGVVEDLGTGADLSFVSATLNDSLGSCDSDGVVDHGEYGQLTVKLRNTGTAALTATTATISSTSQDVWFPVGTTLAFPASAPGATVTATMRIAYLATVSGAQQIDFQLDYTDGQLGAPLTKLFAFRANTNDIAAFTSTDSVESTTLAWTTGFAAALGNPAPWKRLELTPLQHVWHVDDAYVGSDQSLISPIFTVDGSGAFNLQLDHSWNFEFDGGGNYDGGVIEISVNGGAFTDFGASAYNGTILNYSGDVNPLRGRVGFVKTSPTIHTSLTQSIAPGSTIQIQFRAGSDDSVGSGGWNLDNLAFSGVVETPFTTVVADNGGTCTKVPTSADVAIAIDDGVTSVTSGGSVTYTITAQNVSGDDLVGAVVADSFPSGLTCSWTCASSAAAACTASGTGAIFDRVTLPVAGAVTYTAACAIAPSIAGSSLANTATVTPPGPVIDAVLTNNTATDTDELLHVGAHLIAGKIVDGTFTQGGSVTYTIAVRNDGEGTQFDNPGNELIDVLPAGLTLVSASATSGTAAATLITNTVTWNGTLVSGASATITIIATIAATAGTTVSNQASINYDGEGSGTNNATTTTDAFVCELK